MRRALSRPSSTVLNATAALGENRPLKRVTSEREFNASS